MSELKYQTLAHLQDSRLDCQRRLDALRVAVEDYQKRLALIDRYIYEKTPREMTLAQIEEALGHRITIV